MDKNALFYTSKVSTELRTVQSEKRIAVQITSSSDASKINDRLKKYVKHGLDKKFSRIIFFISTEKPPKYTINSTVSKAIEGKLQFNPEKDIIDFDDIYSALLPLDVSKRKEVVDYIRQEIRTALSLLGVDYDSKVLKRPSYSFNEESWQPDKEQDGYELTIEHGLGCEPHVKVKDSAGNERSFVQVNTRERNKVVIGANRPFSGTVYLS